MTTILSNKWDASFTRLRLAGLALLLLAMFSVAAQAQLVGIQFTTTGASGVGLRITGFSASGSGPLIIPTTINNQPVTEIGQSAFQSNTNITSVTIPPSVVVVRQSAFFGCSNLTSVTFQGSTGLDLDDFAGCTSLTSVSNVNGPIPDSVFDNCSSLTNVTLANSVTSIGYGAFSGCTSLTSITIPNSVTTIFSGAFENCGLTSVTIPASVTSFPVETFDPGVFSFCNSLTSITVDPNNPNYSSSPDGVLFDKNQTTIIEYPAGKAGTYTIPNTVTSIGDNSGVNHPFSDCTKLTDVTIPNSVTSIGGSSFNGCTGLTSVTIPASVTSISAGAFEYCSNLTSVFFQGNAPTVGTYAFAYDPLVTVYFYNGSGFATPTWNPAPYDAYPAVNLGPFGSAPLGSGWSYSPWFGTYNSTNYPWIYRTDLGFTYVSTSDNTNVYLYVLNGNSGSMGWIYTSSAVFPSVYSFSEGAWLYFGGGTNFYNYSSQAWETY